MTYDEDNDMFSKQQLQVGLKILSTACLGCYNHLSSVTDDGQVQLFGIIISWNETFINQIILKVGKRTKSNDDGSKQNNKTYDWNGSAWVSR